MTRVPAAPGPAVELVLLVAACWLAFIAIPVALGGIGLGWDALNHHIYLGWIAEQPRFHLDLMAASYQSYQYPYLYWPVYRLLQAGASGVWAGLVLVSANAAAVPALWLLAKRLLPDPGWYGMAMRYMSVLLALASGAVLSLFDATSNDFHAAIPLIWALSFAVMPPSVHSAGQRFAHRWVVLSGACAGLSVAFKLSNGPLAVLFPLIWAWHGSDARQRVVAVLSGCAAAGAAFLLAYGYWGWQLWLEWGNPVFPFADSWFAPIRRWTGHPG